MTDRENRDPGWYWVRIGKADHLVPRYWNNLFDNDAQGYWDLKPGEKFFGITQVVSKIEPPEWSPE